MDLSLFPKQLQPQLERQAFGPVNVDGIMRDLERVEGERQQFVDLWRDCMALMMPNRNVLFDNFDSQGNFTPGQTLNTEIFDSSPIFSLRRGAGNIIAALQPPEIEWIRLEAGTDTPDDEVERVNAALEPWTKVLFEHLSVAGDATESLSMTMDLMMGFGAMTVEEGTQERPLKLRAWPAVNVLPVEGADGRVEKIIRRYEMPVGHLRHFWPTVKLSKEQEIALAKDPSKMVCVIEVSHDTGVGQRFTVLDAGSKRIMHDVTPDDPEEPSRWITPRMSRMPGENYGRGPALEALPDVRTLNRTAELELRGAWRHQHPPILADAMSGLNADTFRVGPDAFNLVDGDPNRMVATLNSGGASQHAEIDQQQRRNAIEKMLFAEEIVPPAEALPNVTATAVALRRQAILQERGVDFGRLQREFLFTKVRRSIWILQRKGLFPPVRVDGKEVTVRYAGPMAQAKDVETSNNILQYVTEVTQAVGPEVANLGIKVEDVPQEVGRLRGIPSSILRSDEERQEITQKSAAAAQAQAEADALAQAPAAGTA